MLFRSKSLQSCLTLCNLIDYSLPGNPWDFPGRILEWVAIPFSRGMTTHSTILAWRIPWTEEPGGPGPGAALTLPAGPSQDHIRSWTGLGQGCWGGGIGSGLPLPLSDMKPPIYLKACGGRQAVTCERPGFPAFPGRLSSVLLLIKW